MGHKRPGLVIPSSFLQEGSPQLMDPGRDNRMISVHFQGKPFNIKVIQVYAPTGNAEGAEVEWFYEDLQELLNLTPKKMSFSS